MMQTYGNMTQEDDAVGLPEKKVLSIIEREGQIKKKNISFLHVFWAIQI